MAARTKPTPLQPPAPRLRVRLLGEMRITRGEQRVALPPSRKTRALLAYLLLSGRRHRREQLCSMFWDVADDPRGALRWSLSKLRGLVNEPDAERIIATRDEVHFSPDGCWVDVLELRQALSISAVAQAETPDLERWSAAFGGELMEGLSLPDFHDFSAFVVAEREQTRKLRARIVGELCARLLDDPEQALGHARTWVQVDPLNFDARAGALRVLLDAGRPDEAQQSYESARRMFEELGSRRAEDLREVWNRLRQRQSAEEALPGPAVASEPRDAASGAAVVRLPSPPRLAMVGREEDLRSLQSMVQRCATERTQHAVLLQGEPGIGKSCLVDTLVGHARAAGASVLHGTAFEAEAGRPYGPWIDALRHLGGEQAAELAPLLPELGGGPADGTRERLFAAVSDLIAVRAHQAPPVVMVFDDVQWLDHASAELLHFVIRHSLHRPLALLLSARSDELSDNAGTMRVVRALRRERVLTEHALQPLGADAVRALVSQIPECSHQDRVVEQSGGNPLFALELARIRHDAEEPRAVPESVAEAVRERIEHLGAAAMDVLRWGSVLGGMFTLERLRAMIALEEDALLSALEGLELRSLVLRADGVDGATRYRFAHEVVRAAVYADVSDPRRQLMHRRVAELLAAQNDVDGNLIAEIAHHATLGHDHDLAASACCATGQRCHRVFANGEALLLARRGLRHAEQLEGADRVRRTIELLELQFLTDRPENSRELVGRLHGLAEEALGHELADHARLAFHLISSIHWEGGAWNDARRNTMRAEMASRGASEAQRVEAIAESARCLVLLERDLGHADALLMEAEHRARPLGLEPASLRDAQGMLLLHRGQLEQAGQLFDLAHDLATSERNRFLQYQVLEHQMMVHLEEKRYAQVRSIGEQMVDVAQRLREGSEGPFAHTIVALACHGLGESDPEALEAGFESLRVADAKYRLAYALLHAARLDLEQDEPARALARARESYPIGTLLERPTETLWALLTMAQAACELGDAETEATARTALAQGNWQGASQRAIEELGRLLAPAE